MVRRGSLTEEQQAVVRHTNGPAVVRAVPGAGKTTALLYHIRHLVKEKNVAPARILACTFNRATARDLEAGLKSLDVRGVRVRTLHALGRSILSDAADETQAPIGSDQPAPDDAARLLAYRARSDLARERGISTDELDLSTSEIVDQVARWKQQLAHPTPEDANLPSSARDVLTTATHENPHVESLYRRFEAHRREEQWITYPDMPREAWRTLIQNEAVRTSIRSRYDRILVDEFQDVSCAQFHMLDELMSADGHTMVVGDADQCIYGWRGADPSFLRSFDETYNATAYRLSKSFRLPAGPLLLGSRVIAQNDDRPSKELSLTRGFDGHATLWCPEDDDGATHIADRVSALLDAGTPADDIAVLVRTYAQTPLLESAFRLKKIPYQLRGRAPFYRRSPAKTLLQYLYWANLEHHRRNGGFDESTERARYVDRFAHIVQTPSRDLDPGRIRYLTQQAQTEKRSVLDVWDDHLSRMPDPAADQMHHFLEVAHTLVDRIDTSAGEVLSWLVDEIDYEAALQNGTGNTRRPNPQIQTTRALVRYADPFDTTSALLNNIRDLAAQENNPDVPKPAVDLRSIHRAKGAEWPVVIVPGCTNGTIPLDRNGTTSTPLQEERRLFYVAITRASERLYLQAPDGDERSPLLTDIDAECVLARVERVQSLLDRSPATLSDKELLHLCEDLAALGVHEYIRERWRPSDTARDAFCARLEDLHERVVRAKKRVAAYSQTRAEYENEQQTVRRNELSRLEDLQRTLGDIDLRATSHISDTFVPAHAQLSFSWIEDESRVGVYWEQTHVATLDPLSTPKGDTRVLLTLPWARAAGQFVRMARGRRTLVFTIDWEATKHAVGQAAVDQLSPPTPPSNVDRALTGAPFQSGFDLLRDALCPRTGTD